MPGESGGHHWCSQRRDSCLDFVYLSVVSKLMVYKCPPHQAPGRCEAAISKGALSKIYHVSRGKGSVSLMCTLQQDLGMAHCGTLFSLLVQTLTLKDGHTL